MLPENTRAVAVRVDDVVGVAGFVHPDDHVDVIVTMRPDRGGECSPRSAADSRGGCCWGG